MSLCLREAEKKTGGGKRPVSFLLREEDIGSSPILTELHRLRMSTDVRGIPRGVVDQSSPRLMLSRKGRIVLLLPTDLFHRHFLSACVTRLHRHTHLHTHGK